MASGNFMISNMTHALGSMKVFCEYNKMVNPSELINHPKNANRHSDQQVNALCESISNYGWRHPVIVSNLTGRIVAGHCRKQAAIKLGIDVPVDFQDFKSEVEELAVLVADNVIPELADMDQFLLEENIDELLECDIDLTSIGILEEIEKEKAKKETINLNDSFFVSHVLISFPVDKFDKIQSILENLYSIDGINIETSNN